MKSLAPIIRDRFQALKPEIYRDVLRGIDEREQQVRSAIGDVYFEAVQNIIDSTPRNVEDIIARELHSFKAISVPGTADAAALTLDGEQYEAYVYVTHCLQSSRHNLAHHFFITGSAGTGKSFLLRAIQHWCNSSRFPCLLVAPTGIAARNIDGHTIHSAFSIFGGTVNIAQASFDTMNRNWPA